MSDWYVLQPTDAPLTPAKRVFVTGAAGHIGSAFAQHCHERYALTLMAAPQENAEHVEAYGNVVRADLSELDRLTDLMQNHDALVHLAATPHAHSTWDELLAPNIIGCYHGFAAAHAAGVKRVVYASSIHAVGAAPRAHQVQPNEPVVPGNLYGVGKAFGEALARYYTEQEDMACYPLRIGGYRGPDREHRERDRPSRGEVSWRDLNQLICACLDTTSVRFAIVHALSRNDHDKMCTTQLRELLGYEPVTDYRVRQ